METISEGQPATIEEPKPRRLRRWVVRLLLVGLVLFAAAAIAIRDHIRTLQSLRRIPGTNAYVMDYYVDYHIDEIRARGIDVNCLEESFIATFFPDLVVPIANWMRTYYVPDGIVKVIADGGHHCTSVRLGGTGGDVLFGRNLDWKHDACLVVKIHDAESVASVAVIDIAYLNLNRDDLDETSLLERIPLLFAPYYVGDGMNRHGVAISSMSLDGSQAPYSPGKADLTYPTAKRLILDYATSVDDAIALLDEYNIHFPETKAHLMIVDATGDSAIVEFLDGEVKVTRADGNWQVCTNHQIWGKSEADNDAECRRYRLASDQLAEMQPEASCDDVMRVMESVSFQNWTMWSTVYNLTSGEFCVVYDRKYDRPYRDSIRMASAD